jgi:hypothetical protein
MALPTEECVCKGIQRCAPGDAGHVAEDVEGPRGDLDGHLGPQQPSRNRRGVLAPQDPRDVVLHSLHPLAAPVGVGVVLLHNDVLRPPRVGERKEGRGRRSGRRAKRGASLPSWR